MLWGMDTPKPPPSTEWVGMTTELTSPRTPVRVWVRDIALTLASLCVVLLTVTLLYVWTSVGNALSEMGTPDPTVSWECTPTPEWPC